MGYNANDDARRCSVTTVAGANRDGAAAIAGVFTFFVLLTPAFAQIRIVQANVPFDFVTNNQVMRSGECRLSLNRASK